MPRLVQQLSTLFVISWHKALVYRGDIAAYLIFSVVAPTVALAIWYTVATGGGLGSSPQHIITYYIFIIFVELVTRAWRGIFLVEQIRTGQIVQYILRPPAILLEFITSNLTTKVVQLVAPIMLLGGALIFFPHLFAPEIYQREHVALFIMSLLLAFILWFSLDLSLGMLAFWLEEANEIHGYRFLLSQVASGVLIPFSAMPEGMHTILSFLPFRYAVSAPVEIILGQVEGSAAWELIGIQAAWAVGFILIMRMLYFYGLRRYAIPGQ